MGSRGKACFMLAIVVFALGGATNSYASIDQSLWGISTPTPYFKDSEVTALGFVASVAGDLSIASDKPVCTYLESLFPQIRSTQLDPEKEHWSEHYEFIFAREIWTTNGITIIWAPSGSEWDERFFFRINVKELSTILAPKNTVYSSGSVSVYMG